MLLRGHFWPDVIKELTKASCAIALFMHAIGKPAITFVCWLLARSNSNQNDITLYRSVISVNLVSVQ